MNITDLEPFTKPVLISGAAYGNLQALEALAELQDAAGLENGLWPSSDILPETERAVMGETLLIDHKTFYLTCRHPLRPSEVCCSRAADNHPQFELLPRLA
ncbi:MAG: hypothetical protein ACR2OL_09375 [Anderseniella sp.]